MTSEESTSVEAISNESINIKHITLKKDSKRQYNRKSKTDDKAKELMDKLIEQQQLARIKYEQDEFDAQKKEVEEQKFMRHIIEDIAQKKLKQQSKEGEKKQVTGKLIDLTLVEDGDLCVIDFDINKKLSIEETDKIRQNIIDTMLPANIGSTKTAHGGLHAYCNRDGYTLPSNRCYKEHGGMEQKELVQNRVFGPNSSFRETKINKREILKQVAIND
ncbi:MAG: hypothetical protein EZS28_010467 [Streblomastix strix]|uniref:Uncharacterized protein n=1 Tax=Streblomastix strix TaxID=222440 RepID=A0A5J4WH55_9EUKA|nr:MAG: hypothetical protein EZS28_010467 [Streblomastix strix]